MLEHRPPAITLEPRSVAHAEELFAVLSEAVLYQFIEEEPPPSVEALRRKLERSELRRSPDGSEHWLNWIVRDECGKMAGYVQATVSAYSTNVAYAFGSAFWGRGIATAATSRMLALVVNEFGPQEFQIISERKNIKSIRVAERLGFTAVTPEEAALRKIAVHDVLMRKTRP